MLIIIKFVVKNIFEKKFRTFLIIFSVMISSALFFASSAISGTMGKMYTERLKQYYGTAQLIIHAGEKSPSSFFNISGTDSFKSSMEYIVGGIEGGGVYKNGKVSSVNMSILGMDYEELQKMNPFEISEKANLGQFTGSKIIISTAMSDKYNLLLGSYLDLNINGAKHKFMIYALAHPSGPFVDESQRAYAIIPKDVLGKIYDVRGKVNIIYLKLKDQDQKQDIIKQLSGVYSKYEVREPFSEEDLKRQLGPMTTSFMLMTVIVLFMSVFIIYSSFKVLTIERLPVIGTFRSIGATRKMTDMILLAESALYGIIGGFLGCGLGIAILYVMSYMSRPVWSTGFEATLNFSSSQLIMAFTAALVLSIVSSLIPVVKVSRTPIKEIVLNSKEKGDKKTGTKLILGVVLAAIAFILPGFVPGQLAMVVDVACMLMSVLSVVLLVPYLTNAFIKIFEGIYSQFFGNEGVLAVKNLRDNKSIINNIALLAIGISSLLMINTLSYSVGVEVINVYNDLKFDIWMNFPLGDRSFENALKSVEGVKTTYGDYGVNNVAIARSSSKIMNLQGINTSKYPDYWDVRFEGDRDELLKELDKGRNIVLTTALKDKFGVKKGDTLTIRFSRGERVYKVIGFLNTLMDNGDYAIISERYLKSDAQIAFYSNIYIKTSADPAQVEKAIRDKFKNLNYWSSTMNMMEENNMKSNGQMFAILNGFSVMALLIGIFGIFNNFLISFMERKRYLAIFRSVGMNKKQVVKMIFVEALTGGIIGGTFGLLTGLLLLYNVSHVTRAMNLPITIHYSPIQFVNSMLGGIIITLIASISPALKSSRLNIIEAVKYE